MEDWTAALKPIGVDLNDFLSGNHSWHATSHARPTYCNVCREQLSGVTSHGYSCEVCKCKIHKRCVDKTISNCKWTTLASVGKDIVEDNHGNILMIHQWMEGNLPVSSKCAVCDKTCGSVLRLQDWRCLWCRETVHTACRPKHTIKCRLGSNRLSVVPPTAIHSVGNDDSLEAIQPHGCSPLLVFVNSKSGDNQGVKFLKRFKQILNPAQVFDLIGNGPGPGLRLFRHFNPFRVLVCSGDGSVGWVLSEIDRLNMQLQCHVGVLPLGTGNDLARVLGWGASCDDDTHLPQLLDKYERASTKILDRWSIMVYERSINIGSDTKLTMDSGVRDGISLESTLSTYYNYIMSKLNIILVSVEHETIVNTAKALCGTVIDFIVCISEISNGDDDIEFNNMRQDLKHKLETLLQLLQKAELKKTYQIKNELDENNLTNINEDNIIVNIDKIRNNNVKNTENIAVKKVYKKQLLERANSLKKSVTKLIEHSDKNFSTSILTPFPVPFLPPLSIDNILNLQQLTPTSIANPISISPIPMLRRDSSYSTELNIESLPAPVEFSDCRQETVLDDQNAVLSEEDTTTYQTSQFDDLNSYCHIYETDKLKNEFKDQIGETLKSNPAFRISEEESLGNICHIDSSEASDELPDSYKMYDSKCQSSSSRYSFRQACRGTFSCHQPKLNFGVKECIESDVDASNLISTSPDDEESEDFRKELGVLENNSKKCSIAHFIEGYDIARRSIKCRHLNKTYSEMEVEAEFRFKNLKNEPEKLNGNMDLEVPIESNFAPNKNEINVRIKGSDSNLSTNGDHSSQFQDPKLMGLNDIIFDNDEDNELHNFKGLKRSQTMTGPAVVINPPSPQNFSPNKICDVGELHLDCRRNSFDSCRRLSAASPIMLHASPLRSSHRISSSTALNTRNPSPIPCSTQNVISLNRNKHLPIINPLVALPSWPNVTESGLISQVLLANADALCAPAVPLMDPDETLLEGFFEKCIMNNYFGIGIDAKISLDFHHKREEHPEKCRSRTRNYMWYGVLGSKQWLQKTYKNLDKRVQLECDGQRIPLPSLQGIVILNIPSFMGGTNFWGGTKEDRVFLAPSVDDRILEVVAVFGTIQMAASRLINLQHHRIAQCTTVQIKIMGDEGVPIQVDGEAWVQPPGMIRIIHKNRMKMLCRNKALESSLKSWEEKQKQIKHQSKRTYSQSLCKFTPLSQEEWIILQDFLEATSNLIELIREILLKQKLVKGDDLKKLTDTVNENVKKITIVERETKEKELRSVATDVVLSTKRLQEETLTMIRNAGNVFDGDFVLKLTVAFSKLEHEFKKCLISTKDSIRDTDSASTYVYFLNNTYELDKLCRKGQFWQKLWKVNLTSSKPLDQDVINWSTVEVGIWLESVQLGEYTEVFASNDIRGKELLNLSRRDLKEIGMSKVGHIKRILMAVKELNSIEVDH